MNIGTGEKEHVYIGQKAECIASILDPICTFLSPYNMISFYMHLQSPQKPLPPHPTPLSPYLLLAHSTSCYCKIIIIFALSAVLLRSPWVNMESLKMVSLLSPSSSSSWSSTCCSCSSSVPPFPASVVLVLRVTSVTFYHRLALQSLTGLGRVYNHCSAR